MLFSQLFNSYAAASILTFIAYIVFNILAGFEKGILDYLPGRMVYRVSEIIVGVSDSSVLWINILVTVAITGLLLFWSIRKFRKYDLN